jgi:hypothetical protein
MKPIRFLALTLLLAACASSQQQTATTDTAPQTKAVTQAPAPALDPVGSYEFSTIVDGQTVTGTMHVEGTAGSYKGRIVTSVFPEIPITAASTEGNTLILKGSMPDGDLIIRMAMTGADFKGNWSLGAESGEISGRKLAK